MLSCQKHLFSLEDGVHYINGAYMSPMMRAVEEAGMEGIRKKARPYLIPTSDFFSDADRLRALFATLVQVQPERVALIPSASYGIAVVAKNLPCRKGQNIVVTEAQFPSNVYSWRNLATEKGLEIRTVPYPTEAENRGEVWSQRVTEAIDQDTCLVAMPHVHWANGVRFDLKPSIARAREVGAWFVVDGTQSVGALPFEVTELEVDALICAGYKWLMGPYALGYAYFGPCFDGGKPLEENWINRLNSEDFTSLTDYEDRYQPFAGRYDMGERSNFALVPMGIAALSQLIAWQPSRIQVYCEALTAEFLPLWRERGYGIEADDWRGKHLFGMKLPSDVSVDVLSKKLQEKRISVSVRGGFVRISPNVYNDTSDIEALSEVLLGL